MTRRIGALTALVVLLALTGVTGLLLDGGADAGPVTLVAAAKATLIGLVFLELDRAHPGWLLLALGAVGGLVGGILALLP